MQDDSATSKEMHHDFSLYFPPCGNTWNLGINVQCIIMSLSSLQGPGEKVINESHEHGYASTEKRR